MNIKIVYPIDPKLIVYQIPFGSRMYGTADENSDWDYVVLVNLDLGTTTLQWSGESILINQQPPITLKVDYTYVTADKFEELSINGSNNALFEANYIRTMIVSEARNRWKDLDKFYTYESEKLYLGLAKRDLDYPEDRMVHVRRSIWIAQKLANREIINFSDVRDIPRNTEIPSDPKELKALVKQMRTNLNKRYGKA